MWRLPMHRKNLIAVVFVFMAASLLGAQSDGVWAPKGLAFTNGLVLDPVTPSTIYASSGGSGGYAMFVSTDGGCNWSQLAALPLGDVQLLAIDPVTPTTLYAGWLNGYGGAVYKSIDSGSSWTRAGGLLCCFTPAALAIDPRIGTTLYLATASETAAYGGVFKSTDGGTTWMAAKVGLPSTAVSLVMDPRNPDTLYAGTWSGVFKTTDGGANWAQTALTSGYVDTLAIDPTTPTTVYASARDLRDSIIYKSTDGGTSWRESDSGLPNPRGVIDALVVDFHDLATVYAGSTLAGVFRSTDGGATWSSMNDGLTNLDIHELAIDTQVPATLYAGTWGSGVFATTITPRFLLTIEKMRDGNGVVSSTQS